MQPQRLFVVYSEPGTGVDRLIPPVRTTETLNVLFVQHFVSAQLNIDPDRVEFECPCECPCECACDPLRPIPSPDKDLSAPCRHVGVALKPASTAVCPPYLVKFDDATSPVKLVFPSNSYCWDCKAHMSEEEAQTKCLPLSCGHTRCEQCAQKIVGDREVTFAVCTYCRRLNILSPRIREEILGEGLEKNSLGIIKMKACSNLFAHHSETKTRFCLTHNELVCKECGPPNSSCQLVTCDHPEALKRLNGFANQLAFELCKQHDEFIEEYHLVGKYKAFLGNAAYDTFIRLAVESFTLVHSARVLQLRADVLRFGLSPSPLRTLKGVSQSPLKGVLRLFLDACREVSLSSDHVPALSFEGMLLQLQCANVEYLNFLRNTGFLAAATSARDSLERNLWHYALPQASLELLKEWGADFNSVDADGLTAAHCAALQGDAERLRVVCALGTDPTKRDDRGLAAAHHAAIHDHDDCFKVLPGKCLERRDGVRWTPAHYAAHKGSARCIAFLVSRGVSLFQVATPRGDLPVHLATLGCHINVLQLLHNAGLDLAMPNIKDGVTAIHIAAQGRLDCLKWLHEHSYRLDDPVLDDTRRTALHIAALHDALDCLKFILCHANGTRDTRTHDGKTAAHFAAESGSVACLKILREVGASMTSADANRRKPLHLAARNGHPACLDVLGDVPYSRADVNEALSLAETKGCATCVETLHRWAEALDSAPQPADPSTVLCVPRLSLLLRTGTDSSSATSTASSARTGAAPYPTSRPDPLIRELSNNRISEITEDEYYRLIRSGVPGN